MTRALERPRPSPRRHVSSPPWRLRRRSIAQSPLSKPRGLRLPALKDALGSGWWDDLFRAALPLFPTACDSLHSTQGPSNPLPSFEESAGLSFLHLATKRATDSFPPRAPSRCGIAPITKALTSINGKPILLFKDGEIWELVKPFELLINGNFFH